MTRSSVRPAASGKLMTRLRARGVGEIIDQAFRIYRSHFLLCLAVVSVINVPVLLLINGVNAAISDMPLGSSSSDLGSLVVFMQGFLLYPAQAALAVVVTAAYLNMAVTFKSVYKEVLTYYRPVLGVMAAQLLIWIILAAPPYLVVLAGLAAGETNLDLTFLLPALFIFYIPYAIVQVRLNVTLPAAFIEDLPPTQGLERSWYLTRNYWWRTFGLLVVMAILSAVIAAAPALLIGSLVESLLRPDQDVMASINVAITMLTDTIFQPVALITSILYYYDLRVRKEGFDLEAAIRDAYPAEQEKSISGSKVPTPPIRPRHTRRESAYAGDVYGPQAGEANDTLP